MKTIIYSYPLVQLDCRQSIEESSVYRVILNTGRAPRSGQQCLIPPLQPSPTISNLCSFSSSSNTSPLPRSGKGGGVYDLQTWETNWQRVNTFPPLNTTHLHHSMPLAHSSSQCLRLSPQSVHGIVCCYTVLRSTAFQSWPMGGIGWAGYWLDWAGGPPQISSLLSSYI